MQMSDFEPLIISKNKKSLDDANRFFFHLHRHNMIPVDRITYEREAYHGLFDPNLRITFDKNIRSKVHPKLHDLFGEDDLAFPWKAHFILEVKYFEAPMPSWIKSIIDEFKLEQEALSKYVEGFFAHREFISLAY